MLLKTMLKLTSPVQRYVFAFDVPEVKLDGPQGQSRAVQKVVRGRETVYDQVPEVAADGHFLDYVAFPTASHRAERPQVRRGDEDVSDAQ